MFIIYFKNNMHHWLFSSFRVIQFLPFIKGTLENVISLILVPTNRYIPKVQREDGDTWQEDSTMDISWDSGSIGRHDEEVSIDLARYKMGDDDAPVLDSFRQVINNQLNSGHSQFTVTKGEGDR